MFNTHVLSALVCVCLFVYAISKLSKSATYGRLCSDELPSVTCMAALFSLPGRVVTALIISHLIEETHSGFRGLFFCYEEQLKSGPRALGRTHVKRVAQHRKPFIHRRWPFAARLLFWFWYTIRCRRCPTIVSFLLILETVELYPGCCPPTREGTKTFQSD